jgi:hypothetical protein
MGTRRKDQPTGNPDCAEGFLRLLVVEEDWVEDETLSDSQPLPCTHVINC